MYSSMKIINQRLVGGLLILAVINSSIIPFFIAFIKGHEFALNYFIFVGLGFLYIILSIGSILLYQKTEPYLFVLKSSEEKLSRALGLKAHPEQLKLIKKEERNVAAIKKDINTFNLLKMICEQGSTSLRIIILACTMLLFLGYFGKPDKAIKNLRSIYANEQTSNEQIIEGVIMDINEVIRLNDLKQDLIFDKLDSLNREMLEIQKSLNTNSEDNEI